MLFTFLCPPVGFNVVLPRGIKLTAIVGFAWCEGCPLCGVKFPHGYFASIRVNSVASADGGGILVCPGLCLVWFGSLVCAVLTMGKRGQAR